MTKKFTLSRKLKLTAHGQSVVFTLGKIERPEHVLMKAFIWALYLPQYPNLTVEVFVGDRYKPDVVSYDPERALKDANGGFVFWGESGRVGKDKIYSLARRYPDTHLVIAKWEKNMTPLVQMVQDAVNQRPRTAPFDLLRFADGDAERFIDHNGHINITHDMLNWWQRIETKR